MNRVARWLMETAVTSAAGLTAFVAPAVIAPPKTLPRAPLFPLIHEAVEHLRPGSFLGLGVVGLLAGLLCRTHWLVLGIAAVALLPLCAAIEMFTDKASHNLLPFEVATYGIFALPSVLAAALGRAAPSPFSGRDNSMK